MSFILSLIICTAAVLRLRETPLYFLSLGLLAMSVFVSLIGVASKRNAQSKPGLFRLSTGLTHVTTALGVFLLFVSLSLR